MPTSALRLCFGVGLLALLVLTATAAEAETVKLRSGKELQVDEVRIKEKAVSITIRKDGGTARVDLRFERLDPRALLDLLDRYTDAADGAAKLRSARVARKFGLIEEAAVRFRQAAELDPALADERDAALASMRKQEAADALAGLEKLLRSGGDPRVVLTRAAALLEGTGTARFSAGQLLRITTLARLAQSLLERELKHPGPGLVPEGPGDAAEPPVPQPGPAGEPQPAPAGPALSPAAQGVLADMDKARHARDRAADPKLTATRAARYLETAARALLDSRRVLQKEPGTFGEKTDDMYAALHGLLVATYLDLADLYRQLGRYAEARAMLRSALILDPGNEQAREQRLLIEDDLREESRREYEEPYGVSFYRIGPYGCGPYFGYPRFGLFGHHHRGLHGHGHIGGGVHFAFRFGGGHHHHHSGHTTRHIGRRR